MISVVVVLDGVTTHDHAVSQSLVVHWWSQMPMKSASTNTTRPEDESSQNVMPLSHVSHKCCTSQWTATPCGLHGSEVKHMNWYVT